MVAVPVAMSTTCGLFFLFIFLFFFGVRSASV